MNDEDNKDEVTGGDLAKSITFEVAANTLLDKYTAGLLVAPDPSLISKGIYALTNVGGSALINYFAQRIRGGDFNLGELLTAGGLSLVPGGVQAKTLSGKVVKGTTKGAALGAAQVTGESLINTGEAPELENVLIGGGFGGVLGGGFSTAPEGVKFIKALKTRLGQRSRDKIREQIFEGAQRGRPRGSQLELILQEQEGVEDVSKYGFGPEGPAGGATDDQIMQAYRERTGELDLDPNARGQGELDIKGAEGARVNPRFDYGEDVLANTPPENIKLLSEIGLNNNDAIFLISNYNKSDISRDQAAAIQSLFSTVKEFNDTKKIALPYFLRAMKNIRRDKTPQLDHIAQLKASLPFFNNAPVSQFPEITRIILEEGVFGLGHQRGNFRFLEFDVHTVKSNFFKNKVGANGEIFFKNRDISTPDKLRAAAREYAKIIDESNNVVADAIEQYKFMNKMDISETELEEFVDILGNQPIRRKYSIMQIRNIFKQMEEDGFIETAKQTQKVETEQIKAEQKELSRQQRLKKQLDKDAASVENRQKQMESFLNENLDTFNVNPYPLGMKDESLREAAEDTYRLFKENQLAIEGNVQRSLFEAEERERFIKVMMKSILNRVKRDLKKNK
tara:strand:+ start:40 stop:1902 length:1863 start_codon:yes stop_codon:yes gene_type:complete